MSDIDFRLVQGAITVAEELNMSRAAARLGITQPALTKRMHDLEDRLGVPLFERTNRGVHLTDHCRAFVEEARLAVVHLERAVQRAKASAGAVEEVLHLGRSPYINPYFVTILSTTRLGLYPKLKVEVSSNFSAELSRQVTSGELDLALIVKGTESSLLNYLMIDSASFFVLFRTSDTKLSSLESIKLADVNRQPWAIFGRHVHPVLHERLLLAARESGVIASDLRSIQSAEEAAQLVNQFGGIAFLTSYGAWRAMEPELTIRPLDESTLRIDTVLITRAADTSRVLSEFVRTAMRRLLHQEPAQRVITFAS